MGRGQGRQRRPAGTIATGRQALPAPVRALAARFAAADRPLYLVGGAVRDRLLGQPSADFDLTTAATPPEIRALAAACQPTSLYAVGEKFGTVGLGWGDLKVEITTFRSEVYRPDSRQPTVTFGTTLAADLARRDFTINAIAADLETGALVDPFGGQADLAAGRIRGVGEAAARFREDPLRILRAARFAARLGFTIEPATARAMAAEAPALAIVSRERVRDELTKLLLADQPDVGLAALAAADLLPPVLPEIDPAWPAASAALPVAWDRTRAIVAAVPPVAPLRWAALFHATGPTAADRGAHGLVRLKTDRATIDHVARLLRLQDAPRAAGPWTTPAVRRLRLAAGDAFDDLLALATAVAAGTGAPTDGLATLRAAAAAEPPATLARLESPLAGEAIMALAGRGPGAWLRPIKDRLRDLVIDGALEPDDHDQAAALVRAWLAGV